MKREEYMLHAIALAKKGTGWVSPNPLVGAVIVKNNKIIGEGWHAAYATLHAERHALINCTESPEGADLYVTLEPCCHYGKQPPCTEAIIEAGIKHVFVGSHDPNPLVAGKGISYLREHGVEVTTEFLKKECDELNPVFFHYIKTNLPYVVMKYAMTMDGKIATHTGASKWITSEPARQQVQQDRHRYSAIMVGIGTILADNPSLTCRLPHSKNPTRIICDTHLRTPLESKIVQTANHVPTIIATCVTDTTLHSPYITSGCQILVIPEEKNHLSLPILMQELGCMRIDSILLEGGGTLNWSALEAGIVQKVQAYIAPKLFGGLSAKSPIEGTGIDLPENAFLLENSTITQIGEDFLIESEVKSNVHRNC